MAREQGSSLRSLGTQLGISHATLCRWMAIAKQADRGQEPVGEVVSRPVAVRRVEVVPDARGGLEPRGGLVLVTPQGYRVEGLGVADVARLLEVLR